MVSPVLEDIRVASPQDQEGSRIKYMINAVSKVAPGTAGTGKHWRM